MGLKPSGKKLLLWLHFTILTQIKINVYAKSPLSKTPRIWAKLPRLTDDYSEIIEIDFDVIGII